MSKSLHRLSAAGAALLLIIAGAGAAQAATVGNGHYAVMVEDTPGGPGIGVYTATTDANHPVTLDLGPQNVLFGGGIPSTSWTAIHSYTSGTTYTQRNGQSFLAGAPVPLILEGFVVPGEEALPVGTNGLQTNYSLTMAGGASDDLEISQIVRAVGTVFNDSAVEITTEVVNTGTAPALIGIRYLLDFQIGGGDDGPALQVRNPDGAVTVVEDTFDASTSELYDIIDNNDPADFTCSLGPTNSPFPLFGVSGSINGPAALAPTPPTRLQFVSWQHISGLPGKTFFFQAQDAFFYARGPHDAATCVSGFDDSGVAYFWGENERTALTVDPGQTISVSVFLLSYLPGQPPTFETGEEICDDEIDNDGDGLVDLDDPDCQETEGPPGDPTCEDEIDNDGDGLIDGDDPDCQPPNEPPDCTTAEPDKERLWPPNHRYKSVAVEGVSDPDGDAVSILITGIAQDEPLNWKGDGNTCPDATGVGTDEARLRKERSGLLDGRVYHIFFDADDGRGGVCSGAVTVCVPHDRSKKKQQQCIDQGPLYDSLGPCEVSHQNRIRNRHNIKP